MSYSKLLRWTSRAGLLAVLLIGLVAWRPGVTSTQGPPTQKNEPSPPAEVERTIATFEVAGFDPVSPALAQTPSPVTVDGVFDVDLADVNAKPLKAAIDAAKAQALCYPPRVTFKVLKYSSSDPSWDATLAEARKVALMAALPSLGLQPGQYNPKVGIGTAPPGPNRFSEVQLNFDKFNDQDRDPPQITLTSKPDAGSCVSPGDQIEVTIRASERYEDGHKSWPSGVQMIQLKANGVVVEPTGFWRHPQPCDRQTLTVTYKVPSPAPSVVHLEAIVDDAANPTHEDSKYIDFPTGTQCKNNVMPADCRSKGYVWCCYTDGTELLHDENKVTCRIDWSICGTFYKKTKVVENTPGVDNCKSFFDSVKANLPKQQFCCDCYPKCGAKPERRRSH